MGCSKNLMWKSLDIYSYSICPVVPVFIMSQFVPPRSESTKSSAPFIYFGLDVSGWKKEHFLRKFKSGNEFEREMCL